MSINIPAIYKVAPIFVFGAGIWRRSINVSSAADYINNLTFDYIKTYSFQHRRAYEGQLKAVRPEYDELKEWTITNLAQSRIIKY